MDDTTDTLHEVLARAIDKGLRDVGADLHGCTPATLTGHVIRELRDAGLHPEQAREMHSRLSQVLTELLRGGTTDRDRRKSAYAVLTADQAICGHGWPFVLVECPKCDAPTAATPRPEEQR